MEGTYDFIIFHFEDETQEFGNEKTINLSKLKGKRIGGHIHVGGKNYVPSPIPNKSNEVLPERYLYLLDTETKELEKILIPNFLDYQSVNLYEDIKPSNALYTVYEIRNYVNKEEAISYYRKKYGEDFFINKMVKQSLTESSEHKRSEKVRSTKELWEDYKKEKKVNKEVDKIVTSLL